MPKPSVASRRVKWPDGDHPRRTGRSDTDRASLNPVATRTEKSRVKGRASTYFPLAIDAARCFTHMGKRCRRGPSRNSQFLSPIDPRRCRRRTLGERTLDAKTPCPKILKLEQTAQPRPGRISFSLLRRHVRTEGRRDLPAGGPRRRPQHDFLHRQDVPEEILGRRLLCTTRSWNRTVPVGARVMVTYLKEDGTADKMEPFAEAWLDDCWFVRIVPRPYPIWSSPGPWRLGGRRKTPPPGGFYREWRKSGVVELVAGRHVDSHHRLRADEGVGSVAERPRALPPGR
jgi:hypothetical protein